MTKTAKPLTTPFAFQEEDAARIAGEFGGRCLLANSMGLGKSLTSLLATTLILGSRPTVVVCPASIKWQWQHECSKHFGLRSEILEGTKPRRHTLDLRRPVLIVNYDILRFWLEEILLIGPRTIIIDEGHYLQDPRSLRSQAAVRLCEGVSNVIVLTGTPVVNRPIEMFTCLNILKPNLFSSRWKYAHRYCNARRTYWGWDFSGSSRTEELNGILIKHLMIRRRKEDVLNQLPPKQRSVVVLDINNRHEYEAAKKDFVGWLMKQGIGRVDKALRAMSLVRLATLKQLASAGKLPMAIQWIEDFLASSEDKLIVFAIHRSIIKALHERWPKESVRVDGSVTGKARQLAVDKFLTSSKCRLFIGNVQAAGVGWSAKGVSDTAFVEYPWSPGAFVQAEERTRGIGRGQKDKPTRTHLLVARNTIEEMIIKIIQRKAKVSDAILDGGKGGGVNIYRELMRELKKEKGDETISQRKPFTMPTVLRSRP